LMTCAHDGCSITAERHKGKYVYYRCSYGRGKCDTPYMPGKIVSDRLGEVLKNIHVPDGVLRQIVDALAKNAGVQDAKRIHELNATRQKITALTARIDRLYDDYVSGRIDEDLFTRKMAE
jgi:site-specific DNA recombinase